MAVTLRGCDDTSHTALLSLDASSWKYAYVYLRCRENSAQYRIQSHSSLWIITYFIWIFTGARAIDIAIILPSRKLSVLKTFSLMYYDLSKQRIDFRPMFHLYGVRKRCNSILLFFLSLLCPVFKNETNSLLTQWNVENPTRKIKVVVE